MLLFISFIVALMTTLVSGLISWFGASLIMADWRARAAGVFMPLGFALERYSFSGPLTLETFAKLLAALGSFVAVAILWRCFFKNTLSDHIA
jgi:hypothetical protein